MTDALKTVEEFQTWLRSASPGAQFLYFVGSLMESRYELKFSSDESGRRVVTETPREPTHSIASAVWAAREAGRVVLVQQRIMPEVTGKNGTSRSRGAFAYFAVKAAPRRRSAMADEVRSQFGAIAAGNAYGG